jgi:hypothetical protein
LTPREDARRVADSPAYDRVAAELRDIGVDAKAVGVGIEVEGDVIQFPGARRGRVGEEALKDKVILQVLLSKLGAQDLPVRGVVKGGRVHVVHDGWEVAIVHRTHAEVRDEGTALRADFLADGAHWTRLNERITGIVALNERTTEIVGPGRRVVLPIPPTVADNGQRQRQRQRRALRYWC